MNEDVLDALSGSSRKALRALAATPGDAAHLYNRLTIVRAAIRIGLEVMERQMAHFRSLDKMQEVSALAAGGQGALGTVVAIECCMGILEELHPDLVKENVSDPKKPEGLNGERIRRIDTD